MLLFSERFICCPKFRKLRQAGINSILIRHILKLSRWYIPVDFSWFPAMMENAFGQELSLVISVINNQPF